MLPSAPSSPPPSRPSRSVSLSWPQGCTPQAPATATNARGGVFVQTAQQEAQRAAFVVERAHQEKQSTIVKAQGEARSAELIGEAIKNKPGFLELRRIETAREIANIIANSNNRVLLDAETLLLNVTRKYVSGRQTVC